MINGFRRVFLPATSQNTRLKNLIIVGISALIIHLPFVKVFAAPIKKKTPLSYSLNNRMKKMQPDTGSNLPFHPGIYKKLPFEPLTDNRLPGSKKHGQQPSLEVHKGDGWLEFTIKKDDTLYSLVRTNGLSIKDLYKIMHVGTKTSGLKHFRPGQKLLIHASGKNILEIILHQSSSRKLHVIRLNNIFSAITTVNGVEIDVAKPAKSRHLLVHSKNFPNLRDQFDGKLQSDLEKTINHLGLMNEVNKGKLAIALVDITDLNNPRVATLNGDEMMYAASLPKIAILLGAFVEIEQGDMTLDADTRDSLTQMIRFSSNENATKMLNRVGTHRLQEILMSDRYKLYDPLHNGGLWVGKAYGKSPAFERDPIHNLSHGATVLQTARFYYMMETGQLVSSKLTEVMKEILSHPKINHNFVKGLASHPEAKIYRKSGTWRHWHADSALIEANGYKYIAVALADDPKGGLWLSEMIAPMHELIVPTAYAELSP